MEKRKLKLNELLTFRIFGTTVTGTYEGEFAKDQTIIIKTVADFLVKEGEKQSINRNHLFRPKIEEIEFLEDVEENTKQPLTAEEILKKHWELANKGDHAKIVLEKGSQLDKMELTVCATINAMADFADAQTKPLLEEIAKLKKEVIKWKEESYGETDKLNSERRKIAELEHSLSLYKKENERLSDISDRNDVLTEELFAAKNKCDELKEQTLQEAAEQVREEITGMWNQTSGVSRCDYELGANEALDRLEEILPKFLSQQESVKGVEELRKEFLNGVFEDSKDKNCYVMSPKKVWNFFLPHLTPNNQQSEAEKLLNFIELYTLNYGQMTYEDFNREIKPKI